jgi:flagellar export protein FliJ
MPKPESRFKTVLKVKHIQVKKAQRELAVITVERERAEGELSHLEDTRSDAISGAANKIKAQAADLQAGRAFIDRLSRQIRVQKRNVEEEKSRESRKREELVERSQSEEMIERLDRRVHDEVLKETEKKQQGLIDVVAQRVSGGRPRA